MDTPAEVGLIRFRRHQTRGEYGVAGRGEAEEAPRRIFTDEFKAGAVRLVLDEGKSITEVAHDLDLTVSAFRGWVERERAERTKDKSYDVAKAEVFDYIEVFHNQQRRHSALEYESPAAYERLEPLRRTA